MDSTFNWASSNTFFLEYVKDLCIFIIKIEMFVTNNTLLVSALGDLHDYSRRLDHPNERKIDFDIT